jgi:hypothetical protein
VCSPGSFIWPSTNAIFDPHPGALDSPRTCLRIPARALARRQPECLSACRAPAAWRSRRGPYAGRCRVAPAAGSPTGRPARRGVWTRCAAPPCVASQHGACHRGFCQAAEKTRPDRKWQMGNGKLPGFFHFPFAICHSGCVFSIPPQPVDDFWYSGCPRCRSLSQHDRTIDVKDGYDFAWLFLLRPALPAPAFRAASEMPWDEPQAESPTRCDPPDLRPVLDWNAKCYGTAIGARGYRAPQGCGLLGRADMRRPVPRGQDDET